MTTVLLMTPVTLSVARRLGVSPAPYLISQILASNIGGTATLIGDPPNILIGSAAGLDFGDFLVHLAPVVLLILGVFLVPMAVLFRGTLQVPDEQREAALEATEDHIIRDRGPARPDAHRRRPHHGRLPRPLRARAGGGHHRAPRRHAAHARGSLDPHEMLREVEWSTLFFFVGLFILVEAVVQTGIVGGVADAIADATAGDEGSPPWPLLWFSAMARPIIDNIPYTATAIPVVQQLVDGGMPADALWWSLALGACLGGNLTIVGASANVVVANLAARAGHPIGFGQFLRYGVLVVAMSMVISSVYVWVRYVA